MRKVRDDGLKQLKVQSYDTAFAVEREAFIEAAKDLDQIRRIVAINLVLGLLTVIVGASGRFW
jgi:uncharacterized membrane protein